MRVKILYLGLVRKKVGKNEEEYEIKDGSSLLDLLSRLSEAYSGNLKGIFSAEKESRLDPTFIVTVNGAIADPQRGVNLKDGDTIALMTLIAGGYCPLTFVTIMVWECIQNARDLRVSLKSHQIEILDAGLRVWKKRHLAARRKKIEKAPIFELQYLDSESVNFYIHNISNNI